MLTRSLLLLLLLLQTSCSAFNHSGHRSPPQPGDTLEATWYHVDIPTHDGLTLRATVYQPSLSALQTAPVIIHTHGFGAFRAPQPLSIYGTLVLSGEAAVEAWRRGYWVISYDQRGFGESDGDVGLMSPEHEVRDMSSVIDWLEKSIPRISRDRQGDLLIGTSGESYGGAVQILASMQDARIDAIAPIATWYDLGDALAPNGHPKSIWGDLLIILGGLGSQFDFGMILEDRYRQALSGQISPQVRQELALRSASHYCDAGQAIQADALFLQGFRDGLFPLNQGVANWQCATKAGRDARFIALQDGHVIPWPVQAWSGVPLFNTQSQIVCGTKTFTAVDLVIQWWDEKLRGITPAVATPRVCISFSEEEGLEMDDLPEAGHSVPVRQAEVSLGYSGLFETLMEPLDRLSDALTPTRSVPQADGQSVRGGQLRPAFIPLLRADNALDLAGIPVLDAQLNTDKENKAGTLYVALGVQPAGGQRIIVLEEQYAPLPGSGPHRLAMPGVAYRLQPGDTLGLLAQGFTGAFYRGGNGWSGSATLSGKIALPLRPRELYPKEP